MKIYYIYHHLGLGDSFVCNGLVRFYNNQLGKINIFSKLHNYETLKFMYRDNPDIIVIPVDGDQNVYTYLNNCKYNEGDEVYLIKVGFEYLWANGDKPDMPHYSPNPGFDVRFYDLVGVPYQNRWDMFKVERDLEREKNLFDSYGVKEGEYVFVHDDNRFKIDVSRIESNYPIINPKQGLTENIFDYCYLIEKAEQVHTIESSFQFMIDSLGLNTENYVHRYPRYLTAGEVPIYKTVKKILM